MNFRIDDTNYVYFKKIFEVIWRHLSKRLIPINSQEADPMRIINTWEVKSKAKARRVLAIGLRDFISQVKNYPDDVKQAINVELAASQLPDLTTLSGLKDRIISRVLQKKKISNPEEYVVVKEEVIDMSTDLSPDQRLLLDGYLSQFESSSTGIA